MRRAGTGLLSMMSAKAMDSTSVSECASIEGMVSACESYLPMGKLMRKVLQANGMERKIRIFHKRSDELKVGLDLPSRADILVSEILDSELLGEGLIPTLQHAHDELLAANPQTVPYRATTYGQLVESTFLWKLHDLHGSEVHASDGVHLTPLGLETGIRVKPQQYAMHCNAMSSEIRLLSKPFKIFEFNFWKRPDSHGETELRIQATDSGTVHAVISWWVLQLDYEGRIFYSTAPLWISSPFNTREEVTYAPGTTDWCDHWKQCVWFIPGTGLSVSKDEVVFFEAVHGDTSISYNLRNAKPEIETGDYDFHIGDSNLILSPERVAIYGDKEWRLAMLTATKNALQSMVSPLCVVADDSVFLTILTASLSTSSHVISIFPGLREKGFLYLEAVADVNGFSMDRVEVLGRRKTCLTLEDTNHRKVDLLIGEPFYYGNEGMLPWQNLRFWKERTMLDSILSEDVLIMPCRGILKACAMSLPDLWRSRRCLQRIEDFDHSAVNEVLGACGDLPTSIEGPCLPYFIWQCGESKELSEPFTVMEFNFTESIRTCFGKAKVEFTRPGICHGFALWIDWVMDAKNEIIISTGPECRYWKQGVKLLSEPVRVSTHGSCSMGEFCLTEINASFNPSTSEFIMESAFL
ncbi:protein arginine N-methyltransferase 7 isoform X2 [Magnolia sinica]|uniref:protein arginine N-methyltransferase 7 isoform X2 n=1 Tax=Magnolia sinica TaxID=86752 RepID=UPI0026592FBB|nr:protein arginine N-methyltransferase 7 isoform X2 [Magnolia sinica]